jgi:hypothetical protein
MRLNGCQAHTTCRERGIEVARARSNEGSPKHPVGARVRPDQRVMPMDDWETPEARLKGAMEILRSLVVIAEKGKKAA